MIRRSSYSLFELTLHGLVIPLGMTALITSLYLEWYQWRDTAIAEQALWHALDVERERSIQERAYKHSIVEGYQARQMKLEEACEAFLAIDSRHPILLRNLRTNLVGSTDLEREARCIVCLASFNVSDPTAKGLLRERLRSDFTKLFPGSAEVSFALFEMAIPETSAPVHSTCPTTNVSVASQP